MFLRWKIRHVPGHSAGYIWSRQDGTRKIHLQERTPYVLLSAQLVESVRTDGRVRQRVVRHVGSLREDATREPTRWLARDRRYFWRRADAILATLPAELAPRIADSLAARVPRPTPTDPRPLAAIAEEARQILQSVEALNREADL